MSVAPQTALEALLADQDAQDQQELMQETFSDTEVKSILLRFGRRLGIELVQVNTDVKVGRTVEGASTVTVTVMDYDRKLLREGNLKNDIDVELDGLFFRLAALRKQGEQMDLIFEEREIAYLRTYNEIPGKDPVAGPILRSQMTRAEFILRLLQEVKEERIKYVIPDLHKVQPIEPSTDVSGTSTDESEVGAPGIPENAGQQFDPRTKQNPPTGSHGITVKGEAATPRQIRNANAILNVGLGMGARRKVLVVSIMVAIQESSIDTNAVNGNHLGIFQQDPDWGSISDRKDPATSAREFFKEAIPADRKNPTLPYYQLGEAVQHSGQPTAYAQWRTEAERFVTAYGVVGGDAANTTATEVGNAMGQFGVLNDGAYYFYRGIPPNTGQSNWKPEDSWTCIQRLADEVNWRAFFVSGTFYFMDEFTLFRSKPRATLNEFMDGVISMDFDYDSNKKSATITVVANLARWGAPPGSVILLTDMGPVNGRWIVEGVERSIFDPYATFTLSKPRPKLPEPSGSNVPSTTGGGWNDPVTTDPHEPSGYVNPLSKIAGLVPERTDQGVDYSGSGPIVAIGRARIYGTQGGGWPGGPFMYYKLLDGPKAGRFIFIAEHISPTVFPGQTVQAGDKIAQMSGGIEIGITNATNGALSLPITPFPPGVSHDSPNVGGLQMARFLQSLGCPVRDDPGPGPD